MCWILTDTMPVYFTNKNKVTFKLEFVSALHHSNADLLWRYIPCRDSITNHIVGELNLIIWDRLLNEEKTEIPSYIDEELQINKYIPETDILPQDELELINLLEGNEIDIDEETETLSTNVSTSINMIGNIINTFYDSYKKFILVGYESSPSHFLEVYQKTLLLQTICYNINFTYGQDMVRHFIYCMSRRYLGINYININFLIKKLSSKYTVAICQRGYGKTTIQAIIATAALLTLRDMNIFMIAHKMEVVQQNRDKIKTFLKIHKMTNNYNFTLKFPNQGIEIIHEDGSRSTLRIASAKNDAALRGPDPNLCLVDETFSIDENKISTIMALGCRNHCPITFFTSPNKTRMINFFRPDNRICFGVLYMFRLFCTNSLHTKYSYSQPACVNLSFYVPRYLNFNQDTRDLTEILAGVFHTYNDEMGTFTSDQIITDKEKFLFHEEFRSSLDNPDTYVNIFDRVKINYDIQRHGYIKIFIYVDPSYGGVEQSATSVVACCILPWSTTPIILFAKFKHIHMSDLIHNDKYIFNMIVDGIDHCKHRFDCVDKEQYVRFYVVMESNSSLASTQCVYSSLIDNYIKYPNPVFLYYGGGKNANNSRYYRPGYTLGYMKTRIFTKTIEYTLNTGMFQIDCLLPECCVVISELKKQSLSFKNIPGHGLTGKLNSKCQDDLIVSLVMAFHFSEIYQKSKFRGEFKPIQECYQSKIKTGFLLNEMRNDIISKRTVYSSANIKTIPIEKRKQSHIIYPVKRRRLSSSSTVYEQDCFD